MEDLLKNIAARYNISVKDAAAILREGVIIGQEADDASVTRDKLTAIVYS